MMTSSLILAAFCFSFFPLSDPCNDVICLNDGVCADGACDCPDGWMGSDCGFFDFTYERVFSAVAIEFSICDDATNNGQLVKADERGRFCKQSNSAGVICQRNSVRFKKDKTATVTQNFTKIFNGEEQAQTFSLEGSYRTDDDTIVFRDTKTRETIIFKVSQDRSSIIWDFDLDDATGCVMSFLMKRVKE